MRKPLLNDFAPYIWKTADFGKTWTKIVTGIRADAYVHAVREDPTRKGLLYAATQHGVYISYDDGASWQSIVFNMPDVPVSDLIVEGNELVIATHGRGFWVLDNLGPLRQATPELLAKDVHVFTPTVAYRSGAGVAISYWLKGAPSRATLEILDSAGAVVRTIEPDTAATGAPRAGGRRRGGEASMPNKAGLNTFNWDLRAQGITPFPGMIFWGGGTAGPSLPPGRYSARLTAENRVATAPIVIKANPWIPDVTVADMRAQYAFGKRVRDKATEANMAVITIRRVKAQLADRQKKAAEDAALKAAGGTLVKNASVVEDSVYQVRNQSGQDPLNFPIRVNNRLATLLAMSERGDGRPTTNMPEIFGILNTELGRYSTQLTKVWTTDLAAVNKELQRLHLPPLDPNCTKVEGCTAVP